MPTRPPPSANRNNLKQTPIPVVSRTMPIVNSDGTVTRSGQLLLEQLQAPTTIEGTHANRPDPSTVPDGSLYVEFDRGVIYCNLNGTWQYIAGTMYALLNPDQRPTDLGANDAGFEFRSIDTDPNYAPRQFLWSQSEWIETTMVLYGTHAARPPADEKTPPRTLYVEDDRGAIYQHQAGFWQYIAGTMWGTMVPDQRPTDLGTHDAGFDFRTTDAPPREFIWSQTAWIETTPPQVGSMQFARASSNLTLPSGTLQDIPGASITLQRAGTYLIQGVFDFLMNFGDGGFYALGVLIAGGAALSGQAVFYSEVATSGQQARATVTQIWSYTAPVANQVAKLQAEKTGGTGTSLATLYSAISAIWVHP